MKNIILITALIVGAAGCANAHDQLVADQSSRLQTQVIELQKKAEQNIDLASQCADVLHKVGVAYDASKQAASTTYETVSPTISTAYENAKPAVVKAVSSAYDASKPVVIQAAKDAGSWMKQKYEEHTNH